MPRLRKLRSAIFAAGVAVAVGCGLLPNADGEQCAEDDDCEGRCELGYCTRGKCKEDADCPSGWRCEANGSGLLGLGGGGKSCRPKCAACPPNRQCKAGANPTEDCPPSPLVEARIERDDDLPVGAPVTLTAKASSANGPIVAYEWTFDDGTRSSEQSVVRTFPRPGPSEVTLVVTDSAAARGTSRSSLAICEPALGACGGGVPCCAPRQCIAGECRGRLTVSAGGPYGGVAGQPVTFHATASSPNAAPIVRYVWAVVQDGRALERVTTTAADFTYTFDRGGPYEIDVRPEDAKGMEGQAKAPVSICDPVGAERCTKSGAYDSCCAPATCSSTTPQSAVCQ